MPNVHQWLTGTGMYKWQWREHDWDQEFEKYSLIVSGCGGGEKNKTLVTTAKQNKIYATVHTVLYNQETIDWE